MIVIDNTKLTEEQLDRLIHVACNYNDETYNIIRRYKENENINVLQDYFGDYTLKLKGKNFDLIGKNNKPNLTIILD